MKFDRMIIKTIQILKTYTAKILINKLRKCNIDLMDFLNEKERIPADRLNGLSKSLRINNQFLAGKIIEIETSKNNLETIIIYNKRRVLKHMSPMSTSGVDIYEKKHNTYNWIKCISPENDTQMYIREKISLGKGRKALCLFLPSYASIANIFVNDVNIKNKQTNVNKIAIYGSSITHGCAASRAGLSYANIIARNLKCEVLNFGFSESAKGEKQVIDYISVLGEKVIILEYDHNAGVVELEETYKSVYENIRAHTNCWIIFMSRFSGGVSIPEEEAYERRQIISSTYNYANSLGDKRVKLIDGNNLFINDKADYLTDGIHPNDLGMHFIANKIIEVINEQEMMDC